jgi:EmrB/QacA subfamily drug resistance transporter
MSTQEILIDAAPRSGRARRAHRRDRAHWAALPVVLTGTFMVVLDFFIVNVALPSMQADLRASAGAIEWVVAGYALTSAVVLVTAGRLGDLLGRRRMFMLGLALFTLASAVCGLAPSPGVLIAARLEQGLAAALLTPQVLAIISVVYTGEDRVKALSAYGMSMGLAAAGGQLLGGALVQLDPAGLGWRSCFLINVPIGALALALTPRLVPESRDQRSTRLDLTGTALLTAGLTAIVLPLVEGRQHGWPEWTWLTLAAAPLLLLTFASHQRRLARAGGAQLLHPELFRARAFRTGLLSQLGFWAGQASYFLVLALYLQQGRGLDAMQAGLVFTILAAAYLAASLRAPALTMRHGRDVLSAGALVLGAGHGLAIAAIAVDGAHAPLALLVPGLLLAGAGMGLVIAPLATTALAGLDAQRAGAASGVLATMQNVGNAVGVAVIGVVFFGALDRGFGPAFELSLAVLAGLLAAVAALTRLLPAWVGDG